MPISRDVRFWAKVRKGPRCWLWRASLLEGGYGYFRWSTALRVGAHRAAWLLTNGEIPNGLQVLHHCDNRRCVRPDHLFLGTQQENLIDMIRKGRSPQGADRPNAKLTPAIVRDMRQRVRSGTTIGAVARYYGVHRTTARQAVRGLKWKAVVQ